VTLYKQARPERVVFTGGEPLLEPRIAEIVLFCKMRKSAVSIITNGTAATKNVYKDLILLQTDLFQLPVHSFNAEAHDKMTGLKGSWEKSVNSILQIKSLGGRVVPVIVITRHNVKEIDKTVQFIISLGIKELMLNRFNFSENAGKEAAGMSASKSELNQAYTAVNTLARDNAMKVSSNVNTPYCVLRPSEYPFIRFSGCASDILRNPITTDIHGNLRKCNHSNVVAGNIFRTSIEEILRSDYLKSWNEIIPDFCKKCSDWPQCRGGCRAAAERTGGNISLPDPMVLLLSENQQLV